jgi:hypothetical protein
MDGAIFGHRCDPYGADAGRCVLYVRRDVAHGERRQEDHTPEHGL